MQSPTTLLSNPRCSAAGGHPGGSVPQIFRMLPFTCAATEMAYYLQADDVKVSVATTITLLLRIDDA